MMRTVIWHNCKQRESSLSAQGMGSIETSKGTKYNTMMEFVYNLYNLYNNRRHPPQACMSDELIAETDAY